MVWTDLKNPDPIHFETTGPEIWEDTIGNIDVLVAGIGTGGTVTGTGRYLKMMNTNIKVVGVEPADRSIISGDNPGFMPNILNIKLLDEVIKVMVGLQFEPFIEDLTSLVKSGEVPISRIDDAVERILRMKFAAGRFEFPFSDRSLLDMVGCKQHRDLAREAVRKSLVLLKNRKDISKPFLPLDRKAKRILVAGTHADDLGFQCGGWTKTWYGCSGRITIAPLYMPYMVQIYDKLLLQIFRFCRSKCHKNFKMKRNPRKVKWTKAYRRVHGKDMTQDSTFEFERKQNRPERYDRNLAENVLKAISKIEKIRQERKDTKGGSKGVGAGHQFGQSSFGPSEGPIYHKRSKSLFPNGTQRITMRWRSDVNAALCV
ncbi:hypothetical protein S245_069806, partial [Arachis hypogaea]